MNAVDAQIEESLKQLQELADGLKHVKSLSHAGRTQVLITCKRILPQLNALKGIVQFKLSWLKAHCSQPVSAGARLPFRR